MIQSIKFIKNRTRSMVLYLAAAAVSGLLIGACTTDSKDVEPTLEIIEPAEGAVIKGPDVFLKVAVTHFTFANGSAKTSAEVKGGHVHVFLDDTTGLDANVITNLSKADTVTLKDIAPGAHFIIVGGAAANHEDVEGMDDTVHFTVAAP